MVCEYIYAKASPRHIMSQSGRKVSERSTKPPGFTIPCYFYMYNISSDDFAVIQTIRAEIYLFTMGTPYKINSRTLVLASSGEGFYHSNLPPPRRSVCPSKNILTRAAPTASQDLSSTMFILWSPAIDTLAPLIAVSNSIYLA